MAVSKISELKMPVTKNHSKDDLLETGKPKSLTTINVNRCRSTTTYREDGSVAANLEMCECSVPLRIEENVLLRSMVVNRGIIQQFAEWYSKQSTMPLPYLIGIPFGWLLLGTFQYFVCIVILGDSFLDPWYFTCAWIVELISTLPVIMIITIIKCLYVQVEILEHCEKVTWTGFTFLLFQGLAIIILLLPVSNLFKHMFGDFSRPINFLIYWMMLAFPHIIILCFATFGCCSKIFRSFSRHFHYANSWKKHETIEAHFETTDRQAAINNDNNIELQELNYYPIFRTK